MIQASPIVIALTHCRQIRKEKGERGWLDLFEGHMIISNFAFATDYNRDCRALSCVSLLSIRVKNSLLLCWRVVTSAFNAHFLRNLHAWYVWIIREFITYILVHIVGINRAKRATLLLHVGSQFLYLDNQWWAHLRQCSTALLDRKVRTLRCDAYGEQWTICRIVCASIKGRIFKAQQSNYCDISVAIYFLRVPRDNLMKLLFPFERHNSENYWKVTCERYASY